MRREKLIQAISNWKFVYTFWAISYVVYVVLRIFRQFEDDKLIDLMNILALNNTTSQGNI